MLRIQALGIKQLREYQSPQFSPRLLLRTGRYIKLYLKCSCDGFVANGLSPMGDGSPSGFADCTTRLFTV